MRRAPLPERHAYSPTNPLSKTFLLSPPSDHKHFDLHPGSHPRARQAQSHYNSTQQFLGPQRSRELGVIRATVSAGEALWIPAGWIHHVTADTTTVSLAVTKDAPELATFNTWLTTEGALRLPKVANDPRGWTIRRLSGVLAAFIPTLLESMQAHERTDSGSSGARGGDGSCDASGVDGVYGSGDDGAGRGGGCGTGNLSELPPIIDALNSLVHRGFTAVVRKELGISQDAAEPFPCEQASKLALVQAL